MGVFARFYFGHNEGEKGTDGSKFQVSSFKDMTQNEWYD